MYKLLKLAFISLLMLCFSACREDDPMMQPMRILSRLTPMPNRTSRQPRKPYSYSCHTATTSTAFCSEILRT